MIQMLRLRDCKAIEFEELAKARGNAYRFLANLMLEEPSPILLKKFTQKAFISSLSDIFGEGVDLMRFTLENAEALQLDFSNLFIVPNMRYLKPYESVYRDKRIIGSKVICGLVHGESYNAVKKLYQEAGVRNNIKELPDHIGLELEFLHFLCIKENWNNKQEALRYLRLEKRFLEEHLLKWVNQLCDTMAANAGTDFYKGLAKITKIFVPDDFKTINKIIKEV